MISTNRPQKGLKSRFENYFCSGSYCEGGGLGGGMHEDRTVRLAGRINVVKCENEKG